MRLSASGRRRAGRPLGKYILRRVLMLIPTLIAMSILVFLMLRLLPGDIVDIIAGDDPQADDAARQRLREAMGLADPIPVQYLRWLGDRKKIEKDFSHLHLDRETDLAWWAEVVTQLLSRKVQVFGYMNNHYAGHSPSSLEILRRHLEKDSA